MKFIYQLISTLFIGLASLHIPTTLANSGYTETRYPLVLVHGVFGFDSITKIDYFYGIPHALSKDGATVFTAQVAATNRSEVRGEQLLAQVETILALTGKEKVNLIGHSQGSPTARYVASVRPDLVASVTSVGGVNWGSRVADIVKNTLPEDSISEALAVKITDNFVALINLLSGGKGLEQDALAALDTLTTEGSLAFNRHYPEGVPTTYCGQGEALASNGVHYFSWTGSSAITNLLDPTDIPIGVLSLAFDEPNDGLVSVCSSHLGQVIGTHYKMNHLDEVNGLLGIRHLFEISLVTLYRQHANRLQQLGL